MYLIIGISVLFVSLFFAENIKSAIHDVGYELIIEIGIALVSAGLIGVMLETKHWSDYFSEKLREIVIEPVYLTQLAAAKVEELRENLYANNYGQEIRDKGSLYNFFNSKTLAELDLPYREEYRLEISVDLVGDKLVYNEKLSYIYRALTKVNIPTKVLWSYDGTKLKNVEFISIDLMRDTFRFEFDNNKLTHKKDGLNSFIEYDIPGDFRKDGLRVILETRYETEPGMLWGFSQTYPVKNISKFSLQYTDKLRIQAEYFGIDEDVKKVKDIPGYYELVYNNWCPTKYGIALLIEKKQLP